MKKYKEEYITIHNHPHYLIHYLGKTEDPVVLYLHGGPGQSEALMVDVADDPLNRSFTMVYYDQRGAGRTRLKNKMDKPSIDELKADLYEIVQYLKKLYHKERIILLGHSWGSVLGSIYALHHPQDLVAYIGCGQLINMQENEHYAYDVLRQSIQSANNQNDMQKLMALGDYPGKGYSKVAYVNMGKFRQLQGKYGLGMKIDMKLIKMALKSPVMNARDILLFLTPNPTVDNLMSFLYSFNLRDYGYTYQVRVYYILGELDQQVPIELSQAYFDKIEAPKKKSFMIPDAGHLMFIDNTLAYREALMEIVEELKNQ